jgi:hypothetical protein
MEERKKGGQLTRWNWTGGRGGGGAGGGAVAGLRQLDQNAPGQWD